MASGFIEVYDSRSNMLSKVRANVGRGKEICLTLHNNRVYCHLMDKSKAFTNGKLDISKCKSVTLGEDEVGFLKSLLGYLLIICVKIEVRSSFTTTR